MSSKQAIMASIEQQLDTMPQFGQLQIYIKSHMGEANRVDIVKLNTVKYTEQEPNVTCAADIYSLIKAIAAAKLDGTLGFSITFKHGQADIMQTQDFKKM